MSRQVVVTGGSSGIGSRVGEAFARQGDTVYVLDRNAPSETDGSDADAGAAPGRAVQHVPCDLADPTSVAAAVEALPETVDVLVNAAGVSGLGGPAITLTVNFFALRDLTEAIAGRIPAGGSVVNIASTAGWYWRDHLDELRPLLEARSTEDRFAVTNTLPDGYTAYSRSKEAVVVWTTIAAQQWLGRFRVNSVSPGPVETPLLTDFYTSMGHAELDPLTARAGGRNGRPEEVAAAIVWLASAEASWVNGTDLPVDAGAEMAEFLAAHLRALPAPNGTADASPTQTTTETANETANETAKGDVDTKELHP